MSADQLLDLVSLPRVLLPHAAPVFSFPTRTETETPRGRETAPEPIKQADVRDQVVSSHPIVGFDLKPSPPGVVSSIGLGPMVFPNLRAKATNSRSVLDFIFSP